MSSVAPTLVDFWRRCPLEQPPYIHPDDKPLLPAKFIAIEKGFEAYCESDQFWVPDDTRLHVALLPMPFTGDLQNAKIFILMLNPGLGPSDYFGEFLQPDYHQALVENLRQEDLDEQFPFVFLNPKFSWHGGFVYWEKKFRNVIVSWMKKTGGTYASGLAAIARISCSIDLFPYHSRQFGLPPRVCSQLASSIAALRFVRESLVERAERGEISIIVTRKTKQWNLDPSESIIVYDGGEAQGAHLTVKSRGGQVIARALGIV